ncbi:MAG TPA: serine hydrolase domain-containing protein [bacterium]|nr:serine hydrolase domain-containing protein [bacterium]HOC88254.1 serine hydrolase domain-containing protein [bacterium]
MRKLVLFMLLIASVLPCAGQSAADKPDLDAAVTLLRAWLGEKMSCDGIPGLAAGVVAHGRLVWAEGFGYADLENKRPMTPQTLSRIASITKTFTATAIMQLQEQGALRLDDPVEKYLPWFKIRSQWPAEPPITIRQLLTHTSGLPGEAAFPYWSDHQFPTREQLRAALPGQEQLYPPGRRYRYSNLGLAIAGEVVAAAAGMPYEEYIHSRILAPLGMKDTHVILPESARSRLAASYDYRQPDGRRTALTFPESGGLIPAANITSSVEDLARYLIAHMAGDSSAILSAFSLNEMHRAHWVQPDWSSGRGLGFSVYKRGSRTMVGHSGFVAGYKSMITFCPEEKVGVVVLMNCSDATPSGYAAQIYDEMAPLFPRKKVPAAEPDRSAWPLYAGDYHDPSGWMSKVILWGEKLALYEYSYPANGAPRDGLTELIPEGAHLFRMSGLNGSGELVRFELDDAGRVVRLWKGENYMLPGAR